MLDRWSSILRPTSISVYPVSMLQVGPRTFDGRQQKGAPDAGYWGMKAGFKIVTRDQLLEWRGLIASFQGGLNSFVIGVFDARQAPTLEGIPLFSGGIPHSDGALFSDGSGYSQSNVEIELADDLDEGDVTANFTIVTAGPLRRGMYFSIADRLFIITKPPVENGSEVAVIFWPPSRISASAGTPVEFANPTFTAQLADPKSGAVDLTGLYMGDPTLELEESFDGL